MSNEGTPDDQIGEALLKIVVRDQMMDVIKKPKISLPSILEVQPLNNEQDQKLVDQLAQSVRVIGDWIDQDRNLNCQIDGLAHLGDKKIFPNLVEGIFSDGQINWGRIAVLFYTVGRLAVKMVLADSPTVLSEILDSCLHFFRTKLLPWIRNMGGWISSISALTRFSIEHNSASSSCAIRLPAPLIMAFVCGVLLGSVIAWKLNRSS
ncbi:apoptosis regulator BAX-like isoform X2 [Neoarius graeffei]|uniref:apoptosis regulator BAX-like isoform X2 n=1 Tax=Neoarius graeffei TaxID=443677 RepID=UPI00298BFAF9|nr:apoptosis regulator BAX-like isoform X2 [Neoarius graeffei]